MNRPLCKLCKLRLAERVYHKLRSDGSFLWRNRCGECRRPGRAKKMLRREEKEVLGVPSREVLEQLAKRPCPICNKSIYRPCNDHDHLSNLFRDVICRPCNFLLGFACDDTAILNSAIVYLNRFKGKGGYFVNASATL